MTFGTHPVRLSIWTAFLNSFYLNVVLKVYCIVDYGQIIIANA